MIYIVWEQDDRLVPSLTAFTNRQDAEDYLKKCDELAVQIEMDQYYGFGLMEIPWATTKKQFVKNLTRYTFGGI